MWKENSSKMLSYDIFNAYNHLTTKLNQGKEWSKDNYISGIIMDDILNNIK